MIYNDPNYCFCTVAENVPCGYYFQTYGGGPEGGYVVSLDTKTVWSVERNWGVPFTMREISGCLHTSIGYHGEIRVNECEECEGSHGHKFGVLNCIEFLEHRKCQKCRICKKCKR